MAVNYPVGDFLIRVKNACLVRKREFSLPYSKFVKAVADVMKEEGFLSQVSKQKDSLEISILYHKKQPVLVDLRLISKPGARRYMSVAEIEERKGPSILIISTPKGVISSKEAIKKRLGGEIIAEVW